MKTITKKTLLSLLLGLMMSSSLFAAQISVTPSFSFLYKDRTSPHSYNIEYYVENSDGLTTQLFTVGNSNTFSVATQCYFGSPSSIQVTEPEISPIPINCYRIVVVVTRDDSAIRRGWSSWTTRNGLENGSLDIDVTSFDF